MGHGADGVAAVVVNNDKGPSKLCTQLILAPVIVEKGGSYPIGSMSHCS